MKIKELHIVAIIIIIVSFGILSEQGKVSNNKKISNKNVATIVEKRKSPSIEKLQNYYGNKIIDLNKEEKVLDEITIPDNKETTEKVKAKIPTCPTPKKEYEDMSLLAISQDISLPDMTYIPKNLKEIKLSYATRGGICLSEEALNQFEAMVIKARIDGYNIKASSGFRSYGLQKNVLATAILNGNTNTDIAIAKPGYSEHQLGTTIDITGGTIDYASASILFDQTPESKWMEMYAKDYGFIESYPKGKENITGYMYEPWHYRYVGKEIAEQIIKNGQTTNEYLDSLKKASSI